MSKDISKLPSLDSNLCRWDVDLYHLDAGLAEKSCRIGRNSFRCIYYYRHIIPLGMYIPSSSILLLQGHKETSHQDIMYQIYIDIPARLVPRLGRSRDLGTGTRGGFPRRPGNVETFRVPFPPVFFGTKSLRNNGSSERLRPELLGHHESLVRRHLKIVFGDRKLQTPLVPHRPNGIRIYYLKDTPKNKSDAHHSVSSCLKPTVF